MFATLEGNSNACNQLLKQLSPRLRSYFRGNLLRHGFSDGDSEDLVQEVLIAIFSKRHTYDTSLHLMPWVYAIARYKLADYYRKRKFRMDVTLDYASSIESNENPCLIESAMDLNALLKRLPKKVQTVIRMTKLEGMSIHEASQAAGMSTSSLKVNMHRGLKILAMFVQTRGKNEHK